MAKKYPLRILKLKNCHECLHCDSARTPSSGYAMDYFCKLVPISKPINDRWQSKDYNPHGFEHVVSYVEWPREMRQDGDFPKWCPLKKASR